LYPSQQQNPSATIRPVYAVDILPELQKKKFRVGESQADSDRSGCLWRTVPRDMSPWLNPYEVDQAEDVVKPHLDRPRLGDIC
jgi:hypothetical protein